MTTLQKIIKYLAIALAIFLIISIVSGILGMLGAISGIRFLADRISDREGNEIAQSGEFLFGPYDGDIQYLEMEIGAADIRIAQGESLYVETVNPYISVSETNGHLKIHERSHFGSLEDSCITLYIPEQMAFEDVEIQTGAGRIQIDLLRCEDLTLELGAGETEIQYLQADNCADIEGGAGQIVIHDGTFHDLSLDMGVGKGDITASFTGDTDISAGIGALYLTVLGEPEDYTVHAEQGLGSMEVDNRSITGRTTIGDGPNRLEIKGGIGEISIEFEN